MMYVYILTYIDIYIGNEINKRLMYVDMGLCLFLTYSSTKLLARRKLLAKTCKTRTYVHICVCNIICINM